jgi:hypothetical protein
MRYDLEINIVGELTQKGLKNLADAFYDTDTTTSSIIPPARWDVRTLVETTLINKGAVDTRKYRGGGDIPPAAYTSGIENTGDIALYKFLIRDNIICPLFQGGYVYIHNYKFAWSNNTTVKEFQLDTVLNRYWCDIEGDIDIQSIDIHTLELKYPGYMSYSRRWEYVPLVKVLSSGGGFMLEESLKASYDAVPKDNKFTIIPTTDSFGKVAQNRIYLNGSIIRYKDVNYGTLADKSVGIFGVKEFPLIDLQVDAMGGDGVRVDAYNDYRYFTSVIRVTNTTGQPIDALANWTVKPIITYKQVARSENLDIVYKNLNIIPNSIGFKDGLVCLFNLYGSPGGTILTDDGTNILYPFYMTLTADKAQLSVYDTVRLTAKVTSANKIPVKGAKLTFTLSGDTSKFIESNSETYVSRTGIDGLATASIVVKPNKFGWYIQKEWISEDRKDLILPFDINHYDPKEIYVYFITNDDPVMGKAFAEYGDGGDPTGQFSFLDVLNRAETPLEEVYNRGKSFDTYQINGRKIAYVKLQRDQGSNKLYSSFVKPSLVTPGQTKTLEFRNLFIRNKIEPMIALKNMPVNATLIRDINGITYPKDTPISITGHRPGSLPQREGIPIPVDGIIQDYLTTYTASVTNCTVVHFDQPIPTNERVSAMWLITGSSGFLIANAAFDDSLNNIHLEPAAPIKIPILNFIKSEYEFILSDVDLAGQNTAFGAFSYFTVSEHLDNPFKLNACSYACIYSDAIGKRCTNKKIPGANYYRIDAQDISCIHTPEYDKDRLVWDKSITVEPSPEFKCPGLDARFVNPFILFQGDYVSV